MKLLKGMFKPHVVCEYYHLAGEQLRDGKVQLMDARWAGWYNQAGQKLGRGDLSADDLLRIAQLIGRDDLFLVLPLNASLPNGPALPWVPRFDHTQPGRGHVATYCVYLIESGRVCSVERDDFLKPRILPPGFQRITREEVVEKIMAMTPTESVAS